MKLTKTSRSVLIIAAILLVAAVGLYFNRAKKETPKENTPIIEITSTETPQAQEQFLYFSDGNYDSGQFVFRVNKYELNSSTTTGEKFTPKFPLVGSSSFDNEPIQWSKDGKVMAYSYGDAGGMDAPSEAGSYKLIAKAGIQELTILEGIDVAQVKKWLLTPDGKSIFYIKSDNAEQNSKQYVYRYNMEDKKTEKLIEMTQYAGSSSPWEISGDEQTLFFIKNKESDNRSPYLISYAIANNTLAETKLMENVDLSKAFMGSFMETGINISPDGKLAAYRDKRTETEHGIGIYNIETKESYDLVSAGNKRSTNNIHWSPDSKSITFVTTVFAAGDGQYENVELDKVDIASKTKVKLDDSESGNSSTGFLGALGFSPDGNMIAYTKGKFIRYYDLVKNTNISVGTYSDENYTNIQWVGF